jgi:ribosomal protein S18 acetylase RimI-like enzyme
MPRPHGSRCGESDGAAPSRPNARGMTSLVTDAGVLTITRAAFSDYGAVMAILREAADWLSARGNPQWLHWQMEVGERMLRDRIEHHEVYLFRLGTAPVGTLTIQWSDPDVWEERGLDGLTGYIHGMGIVRSVGGKRVGERMLEWAVETIAAKGRRFARLDAMASNGRLCRYYGERGFRAVGITPLMPRNYVARLFERNLRSRPRSGSKTPA